MRHVREKEESKIVPRLLDWAAETLVWASVKMERTRGEGGLGKKHLVLDRLIL